MLRYQRESSQHTILSTKFKNKKDPKRKNPAHITCRGNITTSPCMIQNMKGEEERSWLVGPPGGPS